MCVHIVVHWTTVCVHWTTVIIVCMCKYTLNYCYNTTIITLCTTVHVGVHWTTVIIVCTYSCTLKKPM